MLFLRSALFNIFFYLWTIISMLVILPGALFGWRLCYSWGRIWPWGLLIGLRVLVGIKYRFEGVENLPKAPFLFVSKHQSAWETAVFPLIVPIPVYVLKKELLSIPLFGWYLKFYGNIPVDRKGGASALKEMVKQAKDRISQGRSIIIYPEGTRTNPGDSLPYHPGVAALYQALDIPAVPVALNSGCFWQRHAFIKKPGTIVVRILPAIPPGKPRKAFMAELVETVESQSRELVEQSKSENQKG
ncbi:lysophospholipid acyltransferase family protein [Rhodovibrionaceae bacterium A322]